MKTLEKYDARMQRVLDHIDRHLDSDLDLERVSRIAAFSKFHFHRQFSATFELSFHRYVQLARLKRASQQLAHSGDQSITDIALEAGYEAPDAFARAFRARLANRLRHSDGLPIGTRGSRPSGRLRSQGANSCK